INDSLKNGNKLITAIVGSSIARNISVKNIETETDEVRLRFKSESDCADALAWLMTNEGQTFMHNVNQLIFIIVTNDIHRVGADETVRRISQTVESVRYSYPGVNIIWQLLQKRSRKTWLLPEGQPVLNEISRCNIQLTQLAAEMKFNTIQPDIPIEYMFDGLHPSAHGTQLDKETWRFNEFTRSKDSVWGRLISKLKLNQTESVRHSLYNVWRRNRQKIENDMSETRLDAVGEN
ncbi:unnamed protein product, partial [Didymodactylos carnosus]